MYFRSHPPISAVDTCPFMCETGCGDEPHHDTGLTYLSQISLIHTLPSSFSHDELPKTCTAMAMATEERPRCYRRSAKVLPRNNVGAAKGVRQGCDRRTSELQRACGGAATGGRRCCDRRTAELQRECGGAAKSCKGEATVL